MVVAQNLTFRDTVGIFFGQSEVLNTLQPQLNQFVRRRVLCGEEVNEESVRQAVSRILVDWEPHVQAAVNDANIREGVDYAATVYNFARQRLYDLIQLVTSPGDVNFASSLMNLCWTSLREFVLLSIHCFTDGLQSLENVFQGRVRSLTEGMNPLIQQWTLNNAFTHLQNLVSDMPISEDQIRHYVLSWEEGQNVRKEWEEKKRKREEDDQESKANEEEPSPEPMETDSAEPEARPAGVTPSTAADTQVVENHVDAQTAAESTASSESLPSGAMAMDTDDLPDVVFGSESWHHAVPLDWVPILVRDSQKMRRQPTLQAPLSDAYLSTMPPKRRKVATANKPQAELSTVISESLRQAITTVGAQPTGDLNHVLKEAGETPAIQKAYQEQMRKSVSDRLKTDVDYKPEKYPNVEKYFRK